MKWRIGSISAILAVAGQINAAALNEWTFSDPVGTKLSAASNSVGTTSFKLKPGFNDSALLTDGAGKLVSRHETPGDGGAWTSGAVLDAALPVTSSGIHYLRYDTAYDLSSGQNDSGTVLGVYFTGSSNSVTDKAAGLVMGYDTGDLTNSVPSGRTVAVLAEELSLTGTLTAIAEVNLNSVPATLKVWYKTGLASPVYAQSDFTTSLNLTSITNLRFHATGDFQPGGSADYAAVDNIRHTTGTTAGGPAWTEITAPLQADSDPQEGFFKANNLDALNLGSSWINGAVPGSAAIAVMDQTVTANITTGLGADLSWRGIALVSNTAAWTISGTNTLTLGSSGIDLSQAQANLTVATPLSLATTQSWNVAASRTLTVSGPISGTDTAPLLKSGEGTLVITNTGNSFQGELTVRDGTLSIANNNVLGTSLLRLDRSTLTSSSATLLASSIVLSNAVTVSNSSDMTLSGIISGQGSLTKTGAGTLFLKAGNSFSGGLINYGVVEAGHYQSLGSGQISMNAGSVLQVSAEAFSLNGAGIPNNIQLATNATLRAGSGATSDASYTLKHEGNISGPGKLRTEGYQVLLYGNNTFSGGLELGQSSYLRYNGPSSLGTGPITTSGGTRLMLAVTGGEIKNNFVLNNTLRFHMNNQLITLSGSLSGNNLLDLQDSGGTLILKGDNSGWNGGINNLRGNKILQVEHQKALGSGTGIISIGGAAGRVVFVVNEEVVLPHAMRFSNAFNATTGVSDPAELQINKNAVFSGNITDWTTISTSGLEKTGAAKLTLRGNNTYSGPTAVLDGILEVNGSLASRLTVSSGATLSGTGTVNHVTLEPNTMLDLINGRMTFNGNLTMNGSVLTRLGVSSTNSALRGNNSNALTASGTLKLDFSGNPSVAINDTFTVFRNWSVLVDNGLAVLPVGLPLFTRLDTSNLFVNGSVTVVPSQISEPGKELQIVDGSTNAIVVDLVITNSSGTPLTFDLSDNAVWDVFYTVNTNASRDNRTASAVIDLIDPDETVPVLTALNDGYSSAIPIGFPFKLYGQTFSNFFVSAEGAIGLGDTADYIGKKSTGILPQGTQPIIAPYWANLTTTGNSIKYRTSSSGLVITYNDIKQEGIGGGTGMAFQTILYTNGQIRIQYSTVNGTLADRAACGIQYGDLSTQTGLIPASGKAALLTPVENKWITWSPSGKITVPANGTVVVQATVNPAGIPAGTVQEFSMSFNWGAGVFTEIPFYVEVEQQKPSIALSTNRIAFSGLAGEKVTDTSLVISNDGNVAVDFTLEDSASDAATYSGAVSNSMSGWNNLTSAILSNWIKPDANRFTTAEDEGFSPLIDIGFEFPFYGSVYTQLSVGVNGGISLGTATRMSAAGDFSTVRSDVPDRFIAPYWGDLILVANSNIRVKGDGDRFVVSWNNMKQHGVPAGTNLSFQAILHKTGEIEFLYKEINGSRWSNTPVGLRNYAERVPVETTETIYVPASSNMVWNSSTETWDTVVTPESTATKTSVFSGVQSVSTNLYMGVSDTYMTTNQIGGTTNTLVRTNLVSGIANRSIKYTKAGLPVITFAPASGTLPVGSSTNISITGNATLQTPGGTNSLISITKLLVEYAAYTKAADVQFTVTNSVEAVMATSLAAEIMDTDGDGIPDDEERLAGTDPLDPDSMFMVSTDSGTRTLNWGKAEGRFYTVWYTTSLGEDFKPHPDATRIQAEWFTDELNKDEPVVFYKVTVE